MGPGRQCACERRHRQRECPVGLSHQSGGGEAGGPSSLCAGVSPSFIAVYPPRYESFMYVCLCWRATITMCSWVAVETSRSLQCNHLRMSLFCMCAYAAWQSMLEAPRHYVQVYAHRAEYFIDVHLPRAFHRVFHSSVPVLSGSACYD